MDADALIARYGLTPHPEGGFFRESYRAQATLPGTPRAVATAIYYLLPQGQRSRLHRIDADELWHFYRGDPLLIVELVPGADAKVTRLGPHDEAGESLTHLVKAGTWFGALPAPRSVFTLVGCTVSPGFDFAHFELGERARLVREFPLAEALIEQLTP
jgi:hypothetical protein